MLQHGRDLSADNEGSTKGHASNRQQSGEVCANGSHKLTKNTHHLSNILESNCQIKELHNKVTISMNFYKQRRRRIPKDRLTINWG